MIFLVIHLFYHLLLSISKVFQHLLCFLSSLGTSVASSSQLIVTRYGDVSLAFNMNGIQRGEKQLSRSSIHLDIS